MFKVFELAVSTVKKMMEKVEDELLIAHAMVVSYESQVEGFRPILDEGLNWVTQMEKVQTRIRDSAKYEGYYPELIPFLDNADDYTITLNKRFMKAVNKEVVTVKEMARRTGKHPSTIYRWCKNGKVKARKNNNRWQILA
jgi:hypothetical protein